MLTIAPPVGLLGHEQPGMLAADERAHGVDFEEAAHVVGRVVSSGVGDQVAALFTSKSSRPKWRRARSIIARVASSSRRSAPKAAASWPASFSSATSCRGAIERLIGVNGDAVSAGRERADDHRADAGRAAGHQGYGLVDHDRWHSVAEPARRYRHFTPWKSAMIFQASSGDSA